MVHSLSLDEELGKVLLIDNANSGSVAPKLVKHGIPYGTCGEEEFLSGKVSLPKSGYNAVIWMMDLGLHEEPEDLRDFLRGAAMRIQGCVDGIALYYGLCGNGLKDIETWGEENLSVPITIMKDRDGCVCDDCISVAVGGPKKYLQLLRKYPGIMYFTPAFAINWDDMKQRMSLFRGTDPNDDSMIRMILEMADYRYVMEIQTGLGDTDAFHESTRRFADSMGLEVMELDREWCTLEPAELSYANAKAMLRKKGDDETDRSSSEPARPCSS